MIICDELVGPAMGRQMVDCGLHPLALLMEPGAGLPRVSGRASLWPARRRRYRCRACGRLGHNRRTCEADQD